MKKLNSEKKKTSHFAKTVKWEKSLALAHLFLRRYNASIGTTLFFQVRRLLEIGQIKNM